MKKSFIFANMMRGLGLCFIFCPMVMCWAMFWYHINWVIALAQMCVGAYLVGSIFVREFDNNRVKSSVYNLTGIAGCVLSLSTVYMSGSLPHYQPTMTPYGIIGVLFVLYSMLCRPSVKESINRQDTRAVLKLQVVEDPKSSGILVHPDAARQMGVQADDPVEVIGGFLGSRYTIGNIKIGSETLDAAKLYLNTDHFNALGLKPDSVVKVSYYKPAEVSESVEGGMELAFSDLEDMK